MKLRSINPHDQSLVGEVDISTESEVKSAVEKARKAFDSWKDLSIGDRVEFIKKYKQSLLDHKEELAELTTKEMGKPLAQSLEDIGFELEFVDYYIEKAEENLADEVVLDRGNEHYRTVFEPFGVCVCIAPWNYPLSMFNSGVVPALIAGNTVVFKPTEYTTLSQKLALDLLNQSGLPEGVLGIIYGAGDVGEILTDQQVDLIWFTGSAKAGQLIYKKAGEKFIKAICELGGSSPAIVFADADLDSALTELYFARFSNCGQICSAVKRLFVEESVFEQVVQRFVQRLQQVKIGNPMDNVDFGPLVNKKQLETLKLQVQDGIENGAKVEIGGKAPEDASLYNGNYFEPTILTNVNSEMRVMTEEVFGPVLPIMSFKTEDEAIKLANDTEYGLSAEIYTTDLEKGERIARKLQSGAVAINTDGLYKPMCPIGGYKKSGIGREYGRIGMQEFVQVKLIAVKKPA